MLLYLCNRPKLKILFIQVIYYNFVTYQIFNVRYKT